MDQGVATSSEPPAGGDAERLREHGARVERLLEEVRAAAGPQTWAKVEELVARLVELYGAGLERVLAHVEGAGALDARLAARLAGDELVASLLLLHGLHPEPTEVRVRRALEEVAPRLRAHAGGVELVGIDARGVVRVRMKGSCSGCASSSATVSELLRTAIEEAAPEVTGVEEVR